jgi:hypothetical protein
VAKFSHYAFVWLHQFDPNQQSVYGKGSSSKQNRLLDKSSFNFNGVVRYDSWSFGSINDGNSQPINVTSPPGDGYNSYIVNGVTYAKGEYWLDEQQPLPQQIKLYQG